VSGWGAARCRRAAERARRRRRTLGRRGRWRRSPSGERGRSAADRLLVDTDESPGIRAPGRPPVAGEAPKPDRGVRVASPPGPV